MKSLIHFGEMVTGYDIKVLNEREARAASGILFTIALISFMYAFMLGDFYPAKLFVTYFMIDFIIRVLVNPMYSPSMILGRIATSNQKVEYTGAAQKHFAWGLGLVMSITMFVLLVVLNSASPANFIICLLCLIFLFFETAFGICLGCWMYNAFTGQKAQLCPGGVCEIIKKEPIQIISFGHILALVSLIIGIISLVYLMPNHSVQGLKHSNSCVVPQWAKKIGHDTLRLEHNDCIDKSIGSGNQPSNNPNDPCTNIPEGHPKQLRLQHNGCIK